MEYVSEVERRARAALKRLKELERLLAELDASRLRLKDEPYEALEYDAFTKAAEAMAALKREVMPDAERIGSKLGRLHEVLDEAHALIKALDRGGDLLPLTITFDADGLTIHDD